MNTGQFDDLETIARLRDDFSPQSWIHVDGAFGARASVSPQTRHLMRGIKRSDSHTADGHKLLNVPYDAGFVLYRDEKLAMAAVSIESAYQTREEGLMPTP